MDSDLCGRIFRRCARWGFVFLACFGASAAVAADTRAYVQSGLIAHWDGVENAGRGTHASTLSGGWIDLIAARPFTLSNTTVGADRLSFAGNLNSYGQLSDANTTATFNKVGAGGTIEIVVKANNTSAAVAIQSPTVVMSRHSSRSIVSCDTKRPVLNCCWDSVRTNTVTLVYKSSAAQSAYVNGSAISFLADTDYWGTGGSGTIIGTRRNRGNTHFNGSIYAIRLYDRALTADEIAQNAQLDDLRFRQGQTAQAENAILVATESSEPLGIASPSYGLHTGFTAGQACNFTCTTGGTNAANRIAYRCAGWSLLKKDSTVLTNTSANVTSCAFTYDSSFDGATLTWKWTIDTCKLDVLTDGDGSVNVSSQWVSPGTTFAFRATPGDGQKFWRWTGDEISTYQNYVTNISVTVSTSPRAITAHFYDPLTTPQVIRYVTPSGAGAKDGTSWANAFSSIQTAYNSVGENPSGGEVWIRYGKYGHTAPIINGAYTNCFFYLKPNIIVRGGFAGTETRADEADPDANPTILHNGSMNTYPNWSNGDPKWTTDSTGRSWFNEPPVEGDTSLYNGEKSYGRQDIFQSLNCVDDFGTVEFHGLIFTMAWNAAVNVSTKGNHNPFVFRKCRFLDIGWLLHGSVFVIEMNGIGVDMKDCEFSSVQNPFRIRTPSDSSPRQTSTVDSTVFYTGRSNWTTSTASGGVTAYGNVALTIRNCYFDRNIANGVAPGSITWNGLGDFLLEDTVIRRGYSTTSENGGALGYIWKGANAGSFTIRRCRFERCCSDSSGGVHGGQGSAIGVWGAFGKNVISGWIENTAFVSNYTGGASVNAVGSCVCFGSNCYGSSGYCGFTFLNCLFEGNEAVHKSTGTAGCVVGHSWTQGPRPVFANCIFKDNLCGNHDADGNLVCGVEFGREGSPNFAFVNCIFENAYEDMNPWNTSYNNRFCFAWCVSDKSVSYGAGDSSSYRYETLALNADAGLEAKPETNGVVVARRVKLSSAYRRVGHTIWKGTNNELYLYDSAGSAAKPWRPCRKYGTRLTDGEAALIGVSRTAAPVPDAFDQARKGDRCAPGNLNAKSAGFVFTVRRKK